MLKLSPSFLLRNIYIRFSFLLGNIYIRFGSKLYQQSVGIPMATNCAPLIADLVLFCYDRDSMMSLSDDNQSENIEALNSGTWRFF